MPDYNFLVYIMVSWYAQLKDGLGRVEALPVSNQHLSKRSRGIGKRLNDRSFDSRAIRITKNTLFASTYLHRFAYSLAISLP